ncbi:diol dehydratase small subunit [Dethiosulfovibrio sp. F2B]|uniref:diol dehydratase small subunit n=1 Tax=Dethiosulfovibrio faecalis TaxID=2720018 RepID=UPI001F2DF7A7|nr:diol dehydratase small subunit [Dethiosulfovibrio faecalis]MCF4151933.1 diol dehydratase small subunit [Dethiosulfovibrio faecalis]
MTVEINEKLIAEMVRQVLQSGGSQEDGASNSPQETSVKDRKALSKDDYPLAVKRPELLVGPRGKGFDELTLSNIESGNVAFEDFKITPDALEYQAQIAEDDGCHQIAVNLRRAAELTKVPDARVLEIYNAMRPHRSTKSDLLGIADELEKNYGAMVCAELLRETADVYERRKLLKGDLPTE